MTIREHLLRNWPLKIAAVILSAILWVVVAAEETRSELVTVRLEVQLPPTLALTAPPPELRALVTGAGRELIKLAQRPLVLRVVMPPAAVPPRHRFVIAPALVETPRDANVVVQDVEPRELEIGVDRFVRRSVPIALRGTIEAESGFALAGPLVLTPRVAEVSGARALVFGLDSIRTEPLDVRGVTDAFERIVPLDTALTLMRVHPARATLTGRVRRL